MNKKYTPLIIYIVLALLVIAFFVTSTILGSLNPADWFTRPEEPVTVLTTPVLKANRTEAYEGDVIKLTWEQDEHSEDSTLYTYVDGNIYKNETYFGTAAVIRADVSGEWTFCVRSHKYPNVTSASSNGVRVTVTKKTAPTTPGQPDEPQEPEVKQLTAPTIHAEFVRVNDDMYNLEVILVSQDSNADTLKIFPTWNGMRLPTQSVRAITGEVVYSLSNGSDRAGEWKLYAVSSDSAGNYLDSEQSATVTLTLSFSSEEVDNREKLQAPKISVTQTSNFVTITLEEMDPQADITIVSVVSAYNERNYGFIEPDSYRIYAPDFGLGEYTFTAVSSDSSGVYADSDATVVKFTVHR